MGEAGGAAGLGMTGASRTAGPGPSVAARQGPATFERRGIDYIPTGERWGRPQGLFWMWTGAIFNIEFVVYGTLIVAVFGLSFVQAAVIIVVANVFYVLTGLASLQGPEAGTTAFTISRAPFGPNGNRVPAFFNWVTQVGFETEGVALVVLAGLALAHEGGVAASTGLKVGLILGAAAIQLILPLLGHGTILRVLKYLTLPFVALFVILAVLTAPKVHLALPAGHHGASWGTLMIAAALVISAGGLGWTENANDYSRYLPRQTSKGGIVGWVFLGGYLPSVVLEILGAAVATGFVAATGVDITDPISGLPHAFPSWFLVPYLAVAIVQLFAINTLDLYSSGVTLQSLGVRLRRWHCVLIDTTVAAGLTAYAIFSRSFYSDLKNFLLLIIIWLGPWCAIYLIDWALRRGRYDARSLFSTGGGLYWRGGGIHWQAWIAQLLGMVAAAMWINAPPWLIGPLSDTVGGSDFSIYMGLVVGGVTYFLLARRRVAGEAAATSTEEPDLAEVEPTL